MTKDKALKLALEALLEMSPSGPTGSEIWHKQMNAIRVASEALAQPERTGWPAGLLQDDDRKLSKWLASRPDAKHVVDMAQPERTWVGLTDEEMNAALDYWSENERSAYGGAHAADGEYVSMIDTWRYIEAKLKEKNT